MSGRDGNRLCHPAALSTRGAYEEFLPVEARIESRLTSGDPERPAIALSPVFKTPDEVEAGSPLFLDMVEDARVLYDPDGFLGRSFDRRRARLCQLGARRISRGNAWYWELKPDLKPGELRRHGTSAATLCPGVDRLAADVVPLSRNV